LPSRFSPSYRRRKVGEVSAQQSVDDKAERARFESRRSAGSDSRSLLLKRSKLSNENCRKLNVRSKSRYRHVPAGAPVAKQSILKRLLLGVRIVEFNNRYNAADTDNGKGESMKRRRRHSGVNVALTSGSVMTQTKDSETRDWPIADRGLFPMKNRSVSENTKGTFPSAARVSPDSRSLVEAHFQWSHMMRRDAENWPSNISQHCRRPTTAHCELAHKISTATTSLNEQLGEAQTVAKFDKLIVGERPLASLAGFSGCSPATAASSPSRTAHDSNEKLFGRCCQATNYCRCCSSNADPGKNAISGNEDAAFIIKSSKSCLSDRSASFKCVGSTTATAAESTGASGRLLSSPLRCGNVSTDAGRQDESNRIVNWLDEISNFATAYRNFAGLSAEDHVTLLRRARCRLLLLFMAEADFRLKVDSVVFGNESAEPERRGKGSSMSAAAAGQSIREIQMFIDRCRMLDINSLEYHCMRLIALFHSGMISVHEETVVIVA
jgi:hypothetical protein